jgi:type I restriction enzyme, S subunit
MSRWPLVPLNEVCEINPRLSPGTRPPGDTLVTFVPMAAVDEVDGAIVSGQSRPYREVAKGYTAFRNGDVLFAKITPCMENGKSAIARQLVNGLGFGSTEFHILRGTATIEAEYLYHFVRQIEFLRQAKSHFTGTAGQQRVPSSFLQNYRIPLPPISEQRRIVDIMNRAAGIRRLRREVQEKARQFIPALFIKTFGDPLNNPKRWPIVKLGDLGALDRGRSKHRPRNDPRLLGGPYPFIQTGDVANCRGIVTSYSATYSELGLAQSKLWPKGTLCITIAANIARTGVLAFDACFPDSVVGFVPMERVQVTYIQQVLDFFQAHLEQIAPQLAQKNINLKILRSLDVPVPPLALQNAFSELVSDVGAIASQQELAVETTKPLGHSLMTNLLAA